jgi:hypothetical protein
MPKQDIDKIVNELDDKVIDIVGQFVKRRKAAYIDAANLLKEKMRGDLVRYADLLEKKKISSEDFDHLVRGRSAQLKIEVLAEASISKAKFDLVSNEMVSLLIKTSITVLLAL